METYSFGEWMKQRRKQLRLTQREVATAVYCSTAMIKKIEADERQPSLELAQALAVTLQIPAEQHNAFVECARGEQPLDHLTQKIKQIEKLVTLSPLHPVTSSLPNPITRFLGRSAELTDIAAKLRQPDCRLLTLLGPGGMGKTRLAIEVARIVQGDFSDGVLFVPLAAVQEAAQIPQAIAQALQMPLTGSDSPTMQMQRVLRRRHSLLVLDNFEQLMSGSVLLSELLAAAPNLQLLVTSRERLNLVEEWLFSVPALDESAALFRQTAVRVKPDFDVSAEETAVSHICQLVGGHPLAVELAASWTRFMPCAQIAAQIQQDLGFLAHAPRNAPERHRNLRTLFDHSWQLLTLEEQKALAKLSVFRSGFAPEQAAAVAGATWLILLGLVDKSLVESRGNNRFYLHELTRQYATEKLTESGQTQVAQQAHFLAFYAQAQQLMDLYTGPQAIASFRQAEQEHDNFRAALTWGLANQQTEPVLSMTHHLFLFWQRGGHWQEGERWMAAAVAQVSDEDSANLCLLLSNLGAFVAIQGRFPEAFPNVQRAYQMARRLAKPWPLVIALHLRGQSAQDQEGSLAAFAEASAICEQHAGEKRFDSIYCSILWLLGSRLMHFGLLAAAKAKYEESLTHLRALGDVLEIAYPLGNLGRLALQDGNLQEAKQLISESVGIARVGGNRVDIADWVFRLGQIQLYLGEWDAAAVNLQETLHLYEDVGNHFGPPSVLSNLALLALERGDVATANTLIQECFRRYQKLQEAAYKADRSTDFLEFGDTIDSLLHAGLVAYAQGDWQKAVAYFDFFEKNLRGYEAIRPLQEKVTAAQAAIQTNFSSAAYTAAVTKTQQITLNELLVMWLA